MTVGLSAHLRRGWIALAPGAFPEQAMAQRNARQKDAISFTTRERVQITKQQPCPWVGSCASAAWLCRDDSLLAAITHKVPMVVGYMSGRMLSNSCCSILFMFCGVSSWATCRNPFHMPSIPFLSMGKSSLLLEPAEVWV
jgi:hypothetical protein